LTDALATYLTDHLAGSNFAVELLQFLRDQHAGEPLGASLAELLRDIEEDRNVLQGLVEKTGSKVPVLKEAVTWVGEKISEFKLGRGVFGTFEALEALALGIQGKLALWRALSTVAATDPRLHGIDLETLAARAQDQHARAESLRLQKAPHALTPVRQ
jgi:hypothetical protein